MPASRAVLTSSRTSSSVFSWMRMRPRTTFGTVRSVPGRVKVFTGIFSCGSEVGGGSGGGEPRHLVGGELELGRRRGVGDAGGPRRPGDRYDDVRQRQLPG